MKLLSSNKMLFVNILLFNCTKRSTNEILKEIIIKRQKTNSLADGLNYFSKDLEEPSNYSVEKTQISPHGAILTESQTKKIDTSSDETESCSSVEDVSCNDYDCETSSDYEDDYLLQNFEAENQKTQSDHQESYNLEHYHNSAKISSSLENLSQKEPQSNRESNLYLGHLYKIYLYDFIGMNNYDRVFGKHKKYFKKLLKNLQPNDIERYNKDWRTFKLPSSFTNKKKFKLSKTLSEINLGKEVYIFEPIIRLEQKYKINFTFLFRFFTFKATRWDSLANYFDNFGNPIKELLVFKNSFILNTAIRQHFEDTSNLTDTDLFSKRLENLLKDFNSLVDKFAKSISMFFRNSIKTYYNNLSVLFYDINPEVQKAKLILLSEKLFNHGENKAILTLFPELKIYFESLENVYQYRYDYKYFHVLYCLIIYRTHFLYHRTFSKIKNEKNLFESKEFNISILESRLIICLLAFFLRMDDKFLKVFVYKCFYAYVRVKDKDFLKYLLVNDFVDYYENIDTVNLKYLLYKPITIPKSEHFKEFYSFKLNFLSDTLVLKVIAH
ncbi:hypothetical protein TUBRATIS_24110 [Tubulinosema ratisbonensis]|uniref:Uncharacterized protein n=1 Tax=Tubulinosema ratisbonensis TaxID=291195 RepID=A0A437AJ13_9MICR|nr:hypothetical protein TUBRATIS_24110 [Tubulinosema ratisbonensis]